LDVAQAVLSIELLGECFQVDIGGIHHLEERLARDGIDVTVSHGHRFYAQLAASEGGVNSILGPNYRFIVSESNAHAAMGLSRSGNGIWSCNFAPSIGLPGFGGCPVLAKFAAQIAAAGAKRKHCCPGEKLVEWFFLDRIDTETGTATIRGQNNSATLVLANKAKTAVAFFQGTMSWAKVANYPVTTFIDMPPSTNFAPV
jgi:hypothetical protein